MRFRAVIFGFCGEQSTGIEGHAAEALPLVPRDLPIRLLVTRKAGEVVLTLRVAKEARRSAFLVEAVVPKMD